MNSKLLHIAIFLIAYLNTAAAQPQDTVFHKSAKDFEATVLTSGQHHVYTVKYNGEEEKVWQWDYGAYMGVKVLDVMVTGNKFISINSTADDIGYSVYEFKDEKWTPLMGGILFFLNQTGAAVTCKIISENRIKTEIAGETKYYDLDFIKKTATLSENDPRYALPVDKIVIEKGHIYYCQPSQEASNLFQLIRVSAPETDTVFQCVLPEGDFMNHPLCWDVIEGKLIQIGLSSDSRKKTSSNLRYYDIEKIIELAHTDKNLTINYMASPERSLSAYIPPFDLYNDRIYYRNDTLSGKIFFDFTCTRDSFLFFIYLEAEKTMEKWTYHPFPSRLGFKDRTILAGQKPWERLLRVNINLDGPFRAVSLGNKTYLLTESGKLIQAGGLETAEKIKTIDIKDKIILIDKDKKTLSCISSDLLRKENGKMTLEKLEKISALIINGL